MKTQKLFIAGLLVFVLACKKESNNTSRCHIASAVQIGSGPDQTWTMSYNDEGRLTTIDVGGTSPTHKDFSYMTNTIFIVTLDKDGKFMQKDSITIDSKERPISIYTITNEEGTAWQNMDFKYNGDDLLSFVQTNSANTTTTTTAVYSNGNPVSLKTGATTSILEFFTDKKVQEGDFFEFASLIQYGISIYPHKNLVKMITGGGSATTFVYEFNQDGLINKVTASYDTQVSLLSYTYECK